ncbi:MAG: DEAD/DEAH box helicase [Clostridium sp.]|nr:DEAD/DEAH box helicase [Clostridium sp.]
MKLSKLEELVLKNTSTINVKRAEKILDDNELIKFNIHKADNFYNVYGNFKSENKLQSYSAHLRIDFKNEKIVIGRCNCNTYKEGILSNRLYKCEHVIATGLKFISQVKSRMNIAKDSDKRESLENKIVNQIVKSKTFNIHNEKNNNKEQLEISISIKEVKGESNLCFDINFFVGSSKVYPILNLHEFAEKIINDEKYHIGNGLIYNSENYSFSREDMNLIDYLYNYILISRDTNSKNSIRVSSIILEKFLNNMDGKKIKFIYDYQTYLSKVKKENLPLTFTMKKIGDKYIITTRKVFPIPLNKRMNLFFYDRDLYLPSESQIELYKIFYYELKSKGKIELDSNAVRDDFNKIIWSLNNVSNNVYYDENIISDAGNEVKVKFDFVTEDEKYFCKVRLHSDFGSMEYEEALNINNEIICPSKKLRIIESELNNCRFYFRNNRFEFLGSEEEFYEFIKYKFETLQKLGETEWQSDSYKLYYGEFKNIDISEKENGKYDFKFDLNGINTNQIEDVFKAYKRRESYFKLRDGKYVDLTNEDLIKIMRIIDNLNINVENYRDEYEIGLNKLLYLDDRLDVESLYDSNNDNLRKVINEIKNIKDDYEFKVPEGLKCTLRKYQEEGYRWFMNLKKLGLGGILCDEMGLGKTIQTIAFLLAQKGKTSMIIAPTSLIYNWNNEIERFAPELKVGIMHGSNKNKEAILENIDDYNIILTTYGTIRTNSAVYDNFIFENIILDEGQNINNHKSQISTIVKEVKANNKFILTGTPIENNLNELWSLFDFIMPGYLSSNKEFNERFIKNTESKEENIQELRILINPYILRRTKSDVIKELPDKIETVFTIENTEKQQKVYDGFINEIRKNLKESGYNNVDLFSYFTKLRQICIDPSIILEDYDGGSGKIDFINKFIFDKIKQHKILIFSQFTSGLKKVSQILDENKIEYFYLDGSTNAKSRINMADEFNENNDKRIFLISLKAGGTGLNLTSADIVIHLDPWWNPSAEDQASDRAHRIGQKNEVEVIKLIAKGTIEEKIILLQEDKKELINSVITNELKESSVIDKLSSDELLKILVN